MSTLSWKNGLIVLALTAILAAIYFFTPVKDFLTIDKVTELTESVPQTFTTALICLMVFTLGGAMLVPIPLMALAVSLIFDPVFAVVIAVPGFALASCSGYLLGRYLDQKTFGDKFEEKLNKVNKQLDEKGVWAVMALRLAPTPPFTITSIVCGALKLNFRSYVLGTVIGIAPLGLSAVFFGKGAIEVMQNPTGIAASFVVAAIVLFSVYLAIKHKHQKQNQL